MSYIHDAEQSLRNFKLEDMRQALEAAGEIHLRIRAIELAIAAGHPAGMVLGEATRLLDFIKRESKPT